VARRRELLENVAKQVQALGSRGDACPADLTRDEGICSLGECIQRDFGHVNILVLCGGAISHGALDKASLVDLDLMYRSNVRGHYAMLQIMLPLLRKGLGQIVFINFIRWTLFPRHRRPVRRDPARLSLHRGQLAR
jgi:NADP-dependent 3-hydroxy acid dehydrogenase YdfG